MTSTVRSVDVRLNAKVAKYIRDITLAGDVTLKAFSRAHVSVGRVEQDFAQAERSSSSLGQSLKRTESNLDSFTTRLGLVTKAALAVAPAFPAIGAAAIPALTGTANLLGITTVAAGASAIALRGVTDAAKALAKAELEPTAKNIEEAQRQLRDLHPEAAAFVVELNDMIPALKEVRDAGAEGLFPGARDALVELDDALPRIEKFVNTYTSVVGDLLADGAEDLTSGRWTDFVNFLEGEARPTLTTLGGAVGDLAHGMTELWQAMDPANDDLLGGLAKGADVFDRWASGLQDSEGFASFLDYIRDTGPEVVETSLSLAQAVLSIAEAAAPLSGPVLDGIQALADVVSTVADSPLGGLLVGYAATSSVASLAKQGATAAGASPLGTGIVETITNVKDLASAFKDTNKAEEESAEASAENAEEKAALADHVSDAAEKAGELTGANEKAADSDDKATAATAKNAKAQESRTAALRRSAAALGKQAALMGGVMLASSGMADKFGMANTASLALTGAMIGGGAGAAVGGLVGAFMDARNVSKGLEDQLDSLEAVMDSTTATWDLRVNEISASTERWQKQVSDDNDITGFFDFFDDAFSSNSRSLLGALTGADDATRELGEGAALGNKELNNLIVNLDLLSRKIAGGGNALAGKGGLSFFGEEDDRSVEAFRENFEEIDGVIQSVAPALDKMGLGLDALGDENLDTSAVADMVDYLDSAEGRTDAVTDAIAGLDDELLNTTTTAERFGQALSAALDPNINLSAMRDQWITALRTLKNELSDSSKTLKGNSDAAIQNREAVRSRVVQFQAMLQAEAEAGASSEQLARRLRRQRQALIDTGTAAGLSKQEIRDYIRQLGLTPKLVKSLVKLEGVDAAEERLRQLTRDRSVAVNIYTNKPKTTDPGVAGQADGGTVMGPRYPYGDKVLTYLAPGEEVISNRHGQADRFRADRAAGRIPAYANGGTVGLAGGGTVPRLRTSADREADAVTGSLRGMRSEVAALTKVIARERKQRETSIERRSELRDGIRSGLDAGIWRAGNEWSSGDPLGYLRSNLANINQFDKLTGRIKKKAGRSLQGNALDAILAEGDLATLQAYEAMSGADLRAYVQLYTRQQSRLNRVAGDAAGATWDPLIRQSNRELAEANRRLDQLKGAVNRNGRRNADDHDKDRRAQRSGARSAARSAHRGQVR